VRSIWAAGFLLRRLRSEVGVVALLVALVMLTSFLFAGAPRLFNLVADAALVDQLQAAPVVDRGIQLSSTAVSPPGEDPLAELDRIGSEYLQAFPESIRQLIGQRRLSTTSPRFAIPEPPRYRTYVSLRYQDGLDGAITLVAGRLPASNHEALPLATLDFGQEPPPLPQTPPRIEIAVSEATAAEIGVDVGATLEGTLDGADPSLRGFVLRRINAEFQVVGIFSVVDPDADVWFADRRLQRPDIGGTDENPIAYATGLVAPDAYADLTPSGLPFQLAWRYFVAPERADVGQLEAVVPDLERIQSVSADATFGPLLSSSLSLRTGLLGIIGRYLAERSAAEAVLSVAAIGPFALAIGAIAMIAIMLVVRRRASLDLARGRGASGLLLLAAQLWEAGLLAGGAALLGLLLAVGIVPGRQSSLSLLLALATAVAAVAALVLATLPTVRRRLSRAGREDAAVLPTSPRRLVLELTGVGLAVAGVLLLQQRGLVIGDRSTGQVVRLDPFLAAVPVLAGLAMGIVATRPTCRCWC
jgi:putative ABC transport system permease protein